MNLENFWTSKKDSEDFFNQEVEDFYEGKEETKKEEEFEEDIPHGLVSTVDLFEREGITFEEIYTWYADAILRRDREPLEESRFVSHFEGESFEPTFAYGEREKGYLLGYLKFGVFVPTHFAPKTMRGGYELVRNLGESEDIPAVMAITEDLRDTISKMPSWKEFDMKFFAPFREYVAEKRVVYNSHPNTKNLILGLLFEYLKQAGKKTK